MELNKEIKIKILDIENPSKFWFRTIDEANELQKMLLSYFENHEVDDNYEPLRDDVLIFKPTKDQIILMRVHRISNKTKKTVLVSAIGCVATQMIPYPQVQLKDKDIVEKAIKSVLMGAICDISPAELVNTVLTHTIYFMLTTKF